MEKVSNFGQPERLYSVYFFTMSNIYAYGMISKSSLIRLDSPFPVENGYAEIADTHTMVSGETGNSSQVLAKWGHQVRVDGPWMGDNSADFISEYLAARNIDISRLHKEPHYQGIEEIVLSAKSTRTVLGRYKQLLFTTRQWNIPNEDDVIWSDLVSIDPQFGDEALTAAKFAKKHGKPVLGIDCKLDDEILPYFDVLVIGEPYLQNWYGNRDRKELFKAFTERAKGLVIFTRGEKPLWYARAGESLQEMLPHPIQPIDTTGAGDTFRAGLAHGMLLGWDDLQTLRFSGAAAALNCMRFPGVQCSPSLAEIREFIESHHG